MVYVTPHVTTNMLPVLSVTSGLNRSLSCVFNSFSVVTALSGFTWTLVFFFFKIIIIHPSILFFGSDLVFPCRIAVKQAHIAASQSPASWNRLRMSILMGVQSN